MVPALFSNILIVDDDPIIHQILGAFFEKHGVSNIYTAQDGVQGVTVLNQNPAVDLIISDLHMPGADGVEFIEHLKTLECRVPLVVVSSASRTTVQGASMLATAHRLNILGTLGKPVDFQALEQLLGYNAT